jgi:spermidine synthase
MATSIEVSEEEGVRYLHFGSRWIQGAMRIARPNALELEYTRDMMLPLLLRPGRTWPRSVLQIGLGAASITKFLYRNRPRTRLKVIEIEPDVLAAAMHFFKLPDDVTRLDIEIGDGHDYMASTELRFDLIMVDGFDAKGHAGMLDTVPFYCNCKARLTDTGIMVTNLLSRRGGAVESVARIREAFAERVLALPASEAGNTVALATGGAFTHVAFDTLRTSASKLRTETGLNLLPAVARLVRSRGDGADGISL